MTEHATAKACGVIDSDECGARTVFGVGTLPRRGRSDAMQALLPSKRKPAAHMRVPANLDIAIAIDISGSSTAFAQGIPLVIQRLMEYLNKRTSGTKRFWVTGFGDLEYGEDPVPLVDCGTGEEVMSQLGGLPAMFSGGGDAEETHLDSVAWVLKHTPLSKDRTRRRIIVGIFNADTKPLRNGRTLQNLAEEIRGQGAQLFLVCEEFPQLRELVEQTGGFLMPLSNDPDETELITVTDQLGATILHTLTSMSYGPGDRRGDTEVYTGRHTT